MTDFQEAMTIFAEAELIHSPEAVDAAVNRVAEQITQRLKDTNPLMLCVMNGGVPFAGRLLTRMRFPLDFDYIHVSRYGQEYSGGTLSWRVLPQTPVEGRTVLVVDDILDEGDTLAAIVGHMRELGATVCHTAVAVEKQKRGKKPIAADFVALTVPDRFVFGFGMDVRGKWRNLPAIYAVKEN
ncbi:MAG: hypoxanthine-guanine phosphoribosyltransferase [Candidatus Accumulibacter sp.]|jgi:hypoxanthine phosphoribosyltransferase|nr:hypoxanthine-guanine phosphoribosyltransferase [Accumulibacter sp.]